MRIIGQIDHPTLKISVFKNDDRITVKVENSGYEMAFKLGDDERVKNPETLSSLFDAKFLEKINQFFQEMHAAKLSAFARHFPASQEEVFETII